MNGAHFEVCEGETVVFVVGKSETAFHEKDEAGSGRLPKECNVVILQVRQRLWLMLTVTWERRRVRC